MKIAYKILWIDDDLDSLDTDRHEVEEFLESYGIRADISLIEAHSDGSIKEQITHELADEELDMIMVDFNMEGLRGDELIKLIRETDHIYLPVIFYSSSSVEELHSAVQGSQIDGVYIANRQFFMNKVKDVVSSLLVKEETSKQARGLLMEGVSEIDAQFFEVFMKAWDAASQNTKAEIKEYTQLRIIERIEQANKKNQEFPDNQKDFDQFVLDKFLTTYFDTHQRWRLLTKLIKLNATSEQNHIPTLQRFVNSTDELKPALNILRNQYAHQSRKQLHETHTKDLCIHIRKELREQLANIDSLLAAK